MGHVATRGTYGSSSALTSHAITLTDPTAISVGNPLFVCVHATADRTLTVTDTESHTWTVISGDFNDSGDKAHFAWCEVTTGFSAGAEVTLTFSGTSHTAVVVNEFEPVVGIDEQSIADKVNVESENTFSSGTTALTSASDLTVLGFVGINATATVTPNQGSFVARGSASSAGTVRSVYVYSYDAASAGTFEFSGGFSALRNWSAMVFAFEIAPIADPPTNLSVSQVGNDVDVDWDSAGTEFIVRRQTRQ